MLQNLLEAVLFDNVTSKVLYFLTITSVALTNTNLFRKPDGKVAVVEDAEMAADRQTSATTVSKRTTSSNQQQQLGGSSNRTASPAPRTG